MNAPTIYHDDDSLYLEWPKSVLRFPFTEGGLHKALKMIPHIETAHGVPLGTTNLPRKAGPKPKVAKSTLRKREVASFSDDARAGAAAIIRKMGLD